MLSAISILVLKMAYNYPPAVSRWKSLQNLPRMMANPIPVFNEYIAECGDVYTFNFRGSSTKGIFSINPIFHQHVLQKNNRNYRKSEVQSRWLGHYLGKNLLTTEGSYWLRQRRLIQPGFHRQRLAGILNIMHSVIDQYLISLDLRLKNDSEIDIAEDMMELAFLLVARSLFNTSVGPGQLKDLALKITLLQEFLVKQIRLPFLNPWFKFSGLQRKHERISYEAEQIIREVIEARQKSDAEQDDLLQMLIDARYEDTGKTMSYRQLLDETKILFVAGHETTANALAWTWYLLAQHPAALQKIREEVTQINSDGVLQFEDLRKLEYTTQVIEESMRIYPPAWITDRLSMDEDECMGYHYPKNTMIGIYIYGTHHNPKLWEEPTAFKPERFTKEEKKKRIPYSYFPFGGGPRLCIGNNFAMMEMQLVLAKMAMAYDFELAPGHKVKQLPLVTLRPQNGIRLRIRSIH